jgi:hypothetical protein
MSQLSQPQPQACIISPIDSSAPIPSGTSQNDKSHPSNIYSTLQKMECQMPFDAQFDLTVDDARNSVKQRPSTIEGFAKRTLKLEPLFKTFILILAAFIAFNFFFTVFTDALFMIIMIIIVAFILVKLKTKPY